ncbi:hypothetical protein STENM327S_00514 [Streptomyces tendae]
MLTTPQVRAAVAASLDDEGGTNWEEDALDAEELADTVLGLVRDAGLDPGDEPWLGALALPDEDGELSPAGELVFPGGRSPGSCARTNSPPWTPNSPRGGAPSRWPPAASWSPSPWSAQAYTVLKTVKSNSAGNLSTTVKAGADGYYRYVFAGNSASGAITSVSDFVDVK